MVLAVAVAIVGCEGDRIVRGHDGSNYYYSDGIAPDVPTGVQSITHDGFIEIVWQENNDAGLTEGYGVYRYVGTVNNLDQYELIGTVLSVSDAAEAAFRDHDVRNGDTYWYAVNAYNQYGESDLSYEDIFDTPRPDGNATVYDYGTRPTRAGYDFSEFAVVDWDDDMADIYFEYDPSWQLFYVNAAGKHRDLVFLQDYGFVSDIFKVNWGDPGGEWTESGWLPLAVGHAYIVWTADDHYAAFRVNSADTGTKKITITWSYQTDPGNPELKAHIMQSAQSTGNVDRRES